MARERKAVIPIPAAVEILMKGDEVSVSGPRGSLSLSLDGKVAVEVRPKEALVVKAKSFDREGRCLWGLKSRLLANMVTGVSQGFEKSLELVGIGYRAKKEEEALVLKVGYSHPVKISPPEGVSFSLEGETLIKVYGADKQKVGEAAAKIRAVRPPEPYKGKGIKYLGEIVRKKAGKAGKVGTAFGGK